MNFYGTSSVAVIDIIASYTETFTEPDALSSSQLPYVK